jgi:hypothetical protein
VTAHKREKDLKKVAAGRAGAAARKAKQERLLEELRVAKASLTPTPSTDSAPLRVATAGQTVAQEQVSSWTPWIIGTAGLVGALVLLHSNFATAPSLQSATPKQVAQQRRQDTPTSSVVKQLKDYHDPFDME